MHKNSFAILLFLLMAISNIFADISNTTPENYGKIILIDEDASLFINVSYTLTKKDGNVITGFSDSDGWINYPDEIKERFKLVLNLDSDLDWKVLRYDDLDAVYAFTDNLCDNYGYKIVFGRLDGYEQNVEIDLDGNEKYILVIGSGSSTFTISE